MKQDEHRSLFYRSNEFSHFHGKQRHLHHVSDMYSHSPEEHKDTNYSPTTFFTSTKEYVNSFFCLAVDLSICIETNMNSRSNKNFVI